MQVKWYNALYKEGEKDESKTDILQSTHVYTGCDSSGLQTG